MRSYRFLTADVFTSRIFGGNPLAVLPDARGLSDEEMQRVAREMNLSETVFVLPPEDPAHARKLRIFTPAMELPFAGHPTVGTALLLAWTGEVTLPGGAGEMILEEGVGPVTVSITPRDGRAEVATLSSAQRVELRDPAGVDPAALLGLEPGDLADRLPVQAASCGVPFLMIPLRSTDVLSRARLDRGRWDAGLADAWAPHVYPFAPASGESDYRVRMFAPQMGIQEDPATGAAAAAFGGYLTRHLGPGSWVLEQGIEMGRPSRLQVSADTDGTIRVGGTAVPVATGEIVLPD